MKTIKVVGVSGSGKSTLISELKKVDRRIKSVNYGEILQHASGLSREKLHFTKYRHYKLANQELRAFLRRYKKSDYLILFDEHIEIETQKNYLIFLTELYRGESTIGIIFLNTALQEVIKRRPLSSLEKIQADQQIIKNRVQYLTEQLNIPCLTIKTMDLKQGVECATYFIRKLMGR